jgi:hypothetical protein
MIVSTWVLVVVTIKGDISEWMYSGYMVAWAGAQFGSIWLKMKGQTGDTSSETLDSKTTVTSTKSIKGDTK